MVKRKAEPAPEDSPYAACWGCHGATKVLKPCGVPVYHYDCAVEAGADHGPQAAWAEGIHQKVRRVSKDSIQRSVEGSSAIEEEDDEEPEQVLAPTGRSPSRKARR